jgi:vitamin B12 transporter
LRFNDDIFHSQLLTSYSHSKDYNYDPNLGRYDSTATLDEIKQYNVQWLNSVDVGHGNIGAGVDWQKQSTEPGTNYVTNGYDLRNTGVYLTGLQQFGDFTLEGAVRSDDNSQFGRHGTWQSSAAWEFVEGTVSLLLMVRPIKHRIWVNSTVSMAMTILIQKRASSGKVRLKA